MEHVTSPKTYIAVAVTLLLLTLATTGIAYIDLGPWNTVVALAIAAIKASLIILFFMHARFSTGVTRLVIVAGLLWLGILIVGVMDDFITRGWLPVPGH
ncbi:MAG: cytochrome C oxidase subunit IV family protein [Ardenticatenaceae bacterium]|nr:cytochrome C oxidase subunit IV family protein [Ardenticatenaceae bacterium]